MTQTLKPETAGDDGPRSAPTPGSSDFEEPLPPAGRLPAAPLFATESYWRDLVVVQLEPHDGGGSRRGAETCWGRRWRRADPAGFAPRTRPTRPTG